MEYHNLIRGCHLTAQIHYFHQIYRQCDPCHRQPVMHGLSLDVSGCMIYTWQDPDGCGLQPASEVLWRRFLLHGLLKTKPSGWKMLWH